MSPRATSSILAAALAAAVMLVYAPVAGHDWTLYDDDVYLLDNPHVAHGLDRSEIRWVFGHAYAGNYHPLTWVSHMLDVELFGLVPGPHHLVNVALHALNAVLAFLFLRALLGHAWAAGIGAALFALHPLRVESVAWVSERKDVLCAAFTLAALLLYLRHGRAPSLPRYLLVCLALALALLSKPMAVTFPLAALLLDVWPLGRWKVRAGAPGVPSPGRLLARLVLEKVPLFALAGAASLATLWAQSRAGSTSSLSSLALELRALNALRTLAVYLAQNLVPRGLSVFYPHAAIVAEDPVRSLALPALVGAALLAALPALAWRLRRAAPAVTLGLGLFGVTLVPVIGLVQVGTQAHADRYTYLPSLGLAAALAGGALALGARHARVLGALGLLAVLVLGVLARRQLGYWKDTRTLFAHALALDERNYLAHTKLGERALDEGDEPAARAAFLRALSIHPRDVHALNKLALCHRARGELEQAEQRLELALALEPGDFDSALNLAAVAIERDDLARARRLLEALQAREPDHPDVLFDLGLLAQRSGEPGRAAELFERVLARDGRHADAWSNLGQVRLARDELAPALAAFERVVELAPDDPLAHFNLAIARRRAGDEPGARAELRRALELDPAFELARAALGAAEGGG